MRLGDFDALTFDCYGTLIDWESGLLAALAPWRERTAVLAHDDALLEAFGAIEPEIQAERPKALYPEVLAESILRLGARYGAPATADEARAFGQSIGNWPAFPDSAEALAYLKRHFKLVIVSNIDRGSFALSNKKLGVAFDLIVTAQDVGSYKPAPAHFHAAIEALAKIGIAKPRVLHVAQSLFHDHVPAKALGLKTMWINRRAGKSGGGATAAAGPVTPDAEVPTLAAMAELHRAETRG